MINRVELKMKAKEEIKGNILMLFVCSLIVSLIGGALGFIPVVGAIAAIVIEAPLTLGYTMLYLGMTRGEKVEVGNLFKGFNYFKNSLVLLLLQGIFVFLWSLLFVIPGIIKGLSYSMSFYILAENPEMSGREALDESMRIMEGHKMDLFVLQLSFIPWILLTSVTCGLAGIYVIPYMTQTVANFYLAIKDEKIVDTTATVM